eukprot:m.32618 g.32618  ORF g.32618 m.32618 type:complete len:457 (-) comp12450_c0_seq1:26-1396(-)
MTHSCVPKMMWLSRTVALALLVAVATAAPVDEDACWRLAKTGMPSWELRGEYAEGRRLWVEWGATNATECLDVPAGSTAQVWVAEASTMEDVDAVRAAIKQSAARELVSSGTVTVVLGDLPGVAGLPRSTLRIPTSPYALRALRSFRAPAHVIDGLTLGQPNPVIETVLRQVAGPNLLKTVTHLSSYHTRLSTAPGTTEAEVWISSEMIRYGFQVETFPFGTEGQYSANVIATKKGTKYPEQLVIAGAHYDSRAADSSDKTARAPGADDNGSGSSAIIELAKLISENGLELEYTVVLCLFSGEEQGLLGSRAYAQHLAELNTNVVAMFNADMLGYKLPNSEVMIGMKDRSVADWLVEAVKSYSDMYIPSVRTAMSSSCCSDYMSFHDAGFPAVGFFENSGSASDYPHYHKSTDLPAEINEENHVTLSRSLMASFLSFAVPDNDAMIASNAPVFEQL